MFLFSALYIDLRPQNPDEIGDFCEGRRMSDKIRQKKTGLAERCGAMSNFCGEAPGDRGAMSNFRGEATNFCGEATGGNQWPLHKWIDNRNEVKTHILVTHRRSQETISHLSI